MLAMSWDHAAPGASLHCAALRAHYRRSLEPRARPTVPGRANGAPDETLGKGEEGGGRGGVWDAGGRQCETEGKFLCLVWLGRVALNGSVAVYFSLLSRKAFSFISAWATVSNCLQLWASPYRLAIVS